MLTQQVRLCGKIAGVGVSQWAAETMRIGQQEGGLITQRKDNKVRSASGRLPSP